MQPVPDDEVKSLYEGTHVALESMNTFYGLVRIFIWVNMPLKASIILTVKCDVKGCF